MNKAYQDEIKKPNKILTLTEKLDKVLFNEKMTMKDRILIQSIRDHIETPEAVIVIFLTRQISGLSNESLRDKVLKAMVHTYAEQKILGQIKKGK